MLVRELNYICRSVHYSDCSTEKCPILSKCNAIEFAIKTLEGNWCMPFVFNIDDDLLDKYGCMDIEDVIELAEEKRKFILDFGE